MKQIHSNLFLRCVYSSPTLFEMDKIFKSVTSGELLIFTNSLKLNSSHFMTWSKLLGKINNLLPDLNEKLSKECRTFLPVFRVYKPYAHLKLTITSRIRCWLADVGAFFPLFILIREREHEYLKIHNINSLIRVS